MPSEIDLATDEDWSRVGDELEMGTDLTIEWGVWFSRPDGWHVSVYGDTDRAEADAREFVANYTPCEGYSTARVVARRVLTGPWGERDE